MCVLDDRSCRDSNAVACCGFRVRQKEKLQISEEKVAELTQQLQSVQLEQQTLTQRNVMLERLLWMQQAVAAQAPNATGGRSAIEVQKDAWWLDSEMKVRHSCLPLHCLQLHCLLLACVASSCFGKVHSLPSTCLCVPMYSHYASNARTRHRIAGAGN